MFDSVDGSFGLRSSQFRVHNERGDASVSARTPQARLWQSVIIQALRDLYLRDCKANGTNVQGNARNWIFNDNEGFRTVCFWAGLDPEKVRKGVLRMLQTHTKIPDILLGGLRSDAEISSPSLDEGEEEL